MKITVRLKLFLILAAIALSFVILTQVLSIFFLEQFYIYSKKSMIKDCLASVKQYVRDEEVFDTKLFELQSAKGVLITITDEYYNDVYGFVTARQIEFYDNSREPPSTINTIENDNPNIMIKSLIAEYLPDGVDEVFIENDSIGLTKAEGVAISRDSNGNISIGESAQMVHGNFIASRTGFLCILSSITFNNGTRGYVFIQTSVEGIHDSTAAAGNFVLYISLFVLFIGLIIIFFVSKSISKPMINMSEMTKKMAMLDFSYKIKVKSKDEIGEMAENINALSNKLSETITKLNMTNKELTESIKVKEKIDESRKEFIADVSHELKTPISLIGGYAEGLKLNIVGDEKDFYCDVIIDEASKMNRLVLSLLDLMQVESGYAAMNIEEFDIVELVSNIVDRYKLIFEEKHIKVKTNLHSSIFINADSYRIEQAFTNYLNNAISHVETNGEIIIKIQDDNKKVIVSISNIGNPIASEQADKIWNSFYKVDKARNRADGRHGLGLSIVRAIVTAHGGEYGMNNDDLYVTFWFTINKTQI